MQSLHTRHGTIGLISRGPAPRDGKTAQNHNHRCSCANPEPDKAEVSDQSILHRRNIHAAGLWFLRPCPPLRSSTFSASTSDPSTFVSEQIGATAAAYVTEAFHSALQLLTLSACQLFRPLSWAICFPFVKRRRRIEQELRINISNALADYFSKTVAITPPVFWVIVWVSNGDDTDSDVFTQSLLI
jgi:hypothetical protein